MSIIVGIDLHGTLINDQEKFCPESEKELETVLKNKPKNVKLFICTGNDLPFVERKIGNFYDYFNGAVLETGCVISIDAGLEKILIPSDVLLQIKNIEQYLISQNFSEVYKFARRLATISMFTKYDESLENFYQKVKYMLKDNLHCRVTRSSVAVDIIPHNFDKYSGLKYFAESGDKIVALADSLNDLELLKKADLSLLPGNHHKDLPDLIDNNQKCRIFKGEATFGVIEALQHVYSLA